MAGRRKSYKSFCGGGDAPTCYMAREQAKGTGNMEKKTLACDIGGSGGKLFLCGFDGKKLAVEELHRFANSPVHVPGGLYWDILKIFENIKTGIARAKCRGAVSFGVDTMSNDHAFFDKNGIMLENPHTYRDERTVGLVEKMDEFISRRELYQRTGLQFNRMNTLYQWLHMAQERAEFLKIAEYVLFIPDIIAYFLTGEMANEYTLAGVSQAYNPMEGRWDTELMQRIGFDSGMVRPIIRAGNRIGRISKAVREELLLEENMDVLAVGGHDTASAVLSVPTHDRRAAYISSGTWSIVGTETEEPLITDVSYKHGLANEGGALGNNRLLKNVMGLWILQECRRYWAAAGQEMTYAQMAELAAAATGSPALFDPDDEAFYQPCRMPEEIAAYIRSRGGKAPGSVAETVRCVLESLACKYRYVIEAIEEALGYGLACVHIVGGGSNNALLNQLTANFTGKVVYAGPSEATAMGNALAQLYGMGDIASLDEGRDVVAASCHIAAFEPQKGDWDARYREFLQFTGLN